jgi:hypothetical protein
VTRRRCCGQGGYQAVERVALMGLLRAAVDGIPEDAAVWGPRDGKGWVVVDGHGTELGIWGRHTVRATTRTGYLSIDLRTDGMEVSPA